MIAFLNQHFTQNFEIRAVAILKCFLWD